MAKVALEVTMDGDVAFTMDGLHLLMEKMHLIAVVLFFEISLRFLTWYTSENGKTKYPLLSPLFYCAITPVFYLGLILMGMSVEEAQDEGYFFPSLTGDSGGIESSALDNHLFDIFTIISFNKISWTAVAKCIPTLISLTAFSLIHVPINIPAFSISSGVDADMNLELKAHGYSNFLAGLFGGEDI